jgi:hypothetical protein
MIAVAVIHGMGTPEKGFSKQIRGDLVRLCGRAPGGPRLVFEEIYWADILDRQQADLMARLNYRRDLGYTRLRDFYVRSLGDVIAYQPLYRKKCRDEIAVYDLIHRRVGETLRRLSRRVPAGSPLVVLAHSLGTVVMSNHIWDTQRDRRRNLSRFERYETLAGLMTFGSPIALWSVRFKDFGRPIGFPGSGLAPGLRERARWLNFYDPDDVIACPLKKVNPLFDAVVSEDVRVNAGSLLTSWNPMAHNGYWKNRAMLKRIAGFMRSLEEG